MVVGLGGPDVPNRLQQPVVVAPGEPVQDGQFRLLALELVRRADPGIARQRSLEPVDLHVVVTCPPPAVPI